ncbi:MAG: LmbE family protein [Spirochaetaceae bacterium]|nr:MAG: LmbE family protein [Spirochaetaceae bacterium]
MSKRVFALACHPDDIEFMMAGTLFLLRNSGCELHYMNLANGCLGSVELDKAETARVRRVEGMHAAQYVGATFHESLTEDLGVFYAPELVRKVTAVVRRIQPDIMLLPSPEDYMEDHMNTTRVGVTAAFTRGMPNYETDPPEPATSQDVTLYHALPYGLTDGLRRTIVPDFFVDISSVIEDKLNMLACHKSQREWLDRTQGLSSYLETAREMSRSVGAMSGKFELAEGWRRHSHLGFSATDQDPLGEVLAGYCTAGSGGG